MKEILVNMVMMGFFKVDRRTSGISEFVIEEYGGDEKVRFVEGDLNRNNSQIIEV